MNIRTIRAIVAAPILAGLLLASGVISWITRFQTVRMRGSVADPPMQIPLLVRAECWFYNSFLRLGHWINRTRESKKNFDFMYSITGSAIREWSC